MLNCYYYSHFLQRTLSVLRQQFFFSLANSTRCIQCSNNSTVLQQQQGSGDPQEIEDTSASNDEPHSYRLARWNPLSQSVSSDWISWLSQNIDYDNAVQNYFDKARRARQLKMQSYTVERKRVLGGNLLCAQFAVNVMRGKAKVFGEEKWYTWETNRSHPLPGIRRKEDFELEAVDISDSQIIYEGMENLFQAESLLHLSLAKCDQLNEWAIASLVNLPALVSLDLSGNQYITDRCLIPLQHLPNLKKLNLSGIDYFKNQPLALIMLEQLLPDCIIVGVELSSPDDTIQG